MSDQAITPKPLAGAAVPFVNAASPGKRNARRAERVGKEPFVPTAATLPDGPASSLIPPVAVPALATDHPADTDTNEEQIMDTINTAETVTDTAAAKGQALFGEMNDRTKASMEKGARMLEDASAFGKGNMEALVESSKIAAKGVESMSQNAADYARRSFEASTAAVRSLATVKSPTEFMKMQGDFMRQSFDALVAETSRSTEAMLKLAGEVAQPLSSRMAVAADKIKVQA